MNIKKFLLDNLTFENLDKALNKIEKGFTAFQNGMDQLIGKCQELFPHLF